MKKIISLLLSIIMILSLLPTAAAEEGALILPANTKKIEAGAFVGDTSIQSVVIPKKVESIGAGAFAGCTQMQDIYFGNSQTQTIADDAFTGCDDLHFHVFPDTPAELYALSHGFECDLLENDTPAYSKVLELVKNNGGASVLRSNFQSKRLIVVRDNNKLPDISAFHPIDIIRDEDTFFIQFANVMDTTSCYTALLSDSHTVLADEDKCVKLIDGIVSASGAEEELSAAGMMDENVWGTDDPLGFDVYSPYVAENANGKVTIAVLDSGISRLSAYSNMLREDGINMRAAEDGEGWDMDYNMHGSVIASIIKDCVGNNPVSLMSVRVVGAEGNTSNSIIGLGIKYIIDKHKLDPNISIINMSLNFLESAYVKKLINDAVESGITVVVAAGNEGNSLDRVFPANMDNVVTVAGLAQNYKLSNNTNYGTQVDYTAPDCYIKTSAYSWFQASGTSFSTPMIASALALVQLDPYHDVTKMNSTCTVSEDTGLYSASYGHGLPHLDRIAKVPVSKFAMAEGARDVLTVGEDMQLGFSILPENATDKSVEVSSDNEDVIEVDKDANGNIMLHAKAKGTAKLTATTDGGEKTLEHSFTVVQNVTSIQVIGAPEILPLTRTARLSAIVGPEDADEKAVEWISSNTAVAVVDKNGLVTPVGVGTVSITARAADGYGTQSEPVIIPVVDLPDPESIVLMDGETDITGKSLLITPGSSFKIDASIVPEDADQSISFNSDSPCVTVDNSGLVTATQPGTARITAVSDYLNSISAYVDVQVAVMPISLSINGNTVLDEGSTSQLSAVFNPPDTTDQRVTWKSNNNAVATVDGSGVVKGISDGNTVITATSVADSSKTAKVTVTVKHPYTVKFDAVGGTVNGSSTKSAYSGYTIGTLPTASRDYYYFQGWYTGQNGTGERITDTSTPETASSSLTLYAYWIEKEWSDWVSPDAVPQGAKVTDPTYSYRESTESTSSSKSGWINNGSYVRETGRGSKEYASFPGTFDTGHWIYNNLSKEPYYASGSSSNDTWREVSKTHSGYVYWHWMYNVAYQDTTEDWIRHRWISDRKQTAGASRGLSNYWYGYFYAFKSTTDAPKISGFTYTWSANGKHDSGAVTYDCTNCLPGDADWSAGSGLGTPRFLRFDYYTSTYVDYQRIYKYYRDLNYQSVKPTGSNISNLRTYVKYQPK